MFESSTIETPEMPPRPQLEVEEKETREPYVTRAFSRSKEDLKALDEIVSEAKEDVLPPKDYREETEIIMEGLKEEFPRSLAVQDGMQALVSLDSMLADHFFVQGNKDKRKLDNEQKEALKRLASWQQSVANFLIGHMNYVDTRNDAQGIHRQFYSMLEQRVKDGLTKKTFQDVYKKTAAKEDMRQAFEDVWRGAIGTAGAVHVLYSSGRDIRWSTADHDVENKIDLLSKELGGQDLYAVQVKTSRLMKQSTVIPTRDWAEYSADAELMAEIQKVHEGVKQFNEQEQADAEGVMMYLKYSENKMDPLTGFVEPEERKFLADQFASITKG